MKVSREQLLKSLESVAGGLAKKEVLAQSNCFVFREGQVVTFNDEVSVKAPSPLDVEGAVPAEPLLLLLRKLNEAELEVVVKDDALQIKGKNRQSSIRMEQEVLLPVDGLEQPGKYRPIPEKLVEGLKTVSACCSNDESSFLLTCVNVSSDCLEASDDFQIISYPIQTGIKKPFLIKKESIAKLAVLEPTAWCETENWLHFKCASDVVISARRYVEDFPNVSQYMDVEGSAVKLPKGLEAALDKAQIFSGEEQSNNLVTVTFAKGRFEIMGEGATGWYRERRKTDYDGDDLQFKIAPRLLMEISRRSDECVVGEGRIKVDAGTFTYITVTQVKEDE